MRRGAPRGSRRRAGEHRVLIVDDSWPDGTGEIADRLAAELDSVEVLHREEKDGLGRAYAAGFERALAAGAGAGDADGRRLLPRPDHIPALIAAARDADLVIGSRYVAGGGVDRLGPVPAGARAAAPGTPHGARGRRQGPHRRLQVLRRELLERLTLSGFQTAGFGFQVEVTYRALRTGASVREVPILFRDRQIGDSKMSSRIVVEALWKVLRLRLRPLATV